MPTKDQMITREMIVSSVLYTIIQTNATAIRHNMGMLFPHVSPETTMVGIDPDTATDVQWNELVEGAAKKYGGEMWVWYMNSSDTQYKNLVKEIKARYPELMQRTWKEMQYPYKLK